MLRSFLIAAVLVLGACATSPIASSTGEPFDSFEVADGVDLSSFEKVHVAEVLVSEALAARIGYRPLNASDTLRPLSPGNVRRNVEKVQEDLESAVGGVATLVDAPGPGILTVRVILTDLNPNRPSEAELDVRPTLNASSVMSGGAGASVEFLVGDTLVGLGSSSSTGNALSGQSHPWRDADLYFMRLVRDIVAVID